MSSDKKNPEDTSDRKPTGNKGEWAEVYAFFRLLGKPLLRQCDENLETSTEEDGSETGIVRFNKIFRRAHKDQEPLCYVLDEKENQWTLISNGISKVVSAKECDKQADKLLSDIQGWKEGRTKHFRDSYEFLSQQLLSTSIKAKSEEKQDIALGIKEKISGSSVPCGFSIKSLFGSRPTLLNPSRPASLTYKISGIDEETANKIQGYSVRTLEYKKVKDGWIPSIVYRIREAGGSLELHSMHETFEKNMEFIDTRMAEILSYYVLEAYAEKPKETRHRTNSLNISDITKQVSEANPLELSERNKGILYEYKIKRFLEAVALGLTPATEWNGEEDASGGYIIVKENGDLVAFLIYDRALLLKYLFNHTKLEHPDFGKLNNQKDGNKAVGSETGKWKKQNGRKAKREQPTPIGRIFEKNGELFITLPLQIRFVL